MPSGQLILLWDSDEPDWIGLNFTINRTFTDLLRRSVKASYWRYDHSSLSWEVHVTRIESVYRLGRRLFQFVDVSALPPKLQKALAQSMDGDESFGHRTLSKGALDDPYARLYVRDDAPLNVVKAAYRALSKECHPDVGGSPEAFKQINEAYEKIRKMRTPNEYREDAKETGAGTG